MVRHLYYFDACYTSEKSFPMNGPVYAPTISPPRLPLLIYFYISSSSDVLPTTRSFLLSLRSHLHFISHSFFSPLSSLSLSGLQ